MAEKAEKKTTAEAGLPDVDVMMKGLLSQPGVEGYMVFNDAGIPLKWTQGFIKPGSIASSNPIPPAVIHNASLFGDLTVQARAALHRLFGESEGELQLMRLHTRTNEMIVAPSQEFTLVTLQRSHSAAMLPLVGAGAEAPIEAAAAVPEDKKA